MLHFSTLQCVRTVTNEVFLSFSLDYLLLHFQVCPLRVGETNLWPQWLCRCVTCLSHSVVIYWSSLEFSVFILTSVCINTPVMREQPPSDQITSSIKQTPLCGFSTQRSRPLAGGFSQCNSLTGSESEWLPAKQKHNNYHLWSTDWVRTVAFFLWESDSNSRKELLQDKSVTCNENRVSKL